MGGSIAPGYPGSRFAGGRNGLMASRPPYRPGYGWSRPYNHSGDRYGDHDGDHDRFHGRARSFQNWYLYDYPGWLAYGYPYDLNPGFFDWGDNDNSGYDQGNQPSGYYDEGAGYQSQDLVSGYQPQYEANGESSIEEYGRPGEQPPPWPGPGASGTAPENPPSESGVSAAFVPPLDGPLTVIFKGGRAPEKMQDFMLTAKALTDLDTHHYEQIPLDQIDISATAQANRANGLDFEVPGASRD